jgi:hypothetical protein
MSPTLGEIVSRPKHKRKLGSDETKTWQNKNKTTAVVRASLSNVLGILHSLVVAEESDVAVNDGRRRQAVAALMVLH